MRTARIALFGIALVFVLTGWPIDGLRPARADDLAKEFVSPPPSRPAVGLLVLAQRQRHPRRNSR